MDLGFEEAGFPVVYRNEFDPLFARASEYALLQAFPKRPVNLDLRSIIDVAPRSLLRKAFGRGGKPDMFGMIGGPPCPDFSIGGKNRGQHGDRGRLTEVYVTRILETLPAFFVLENVKGLVSTRKHREFLEIQERRLSERYVIHRKVINAIDLGVPQDRERVFIVGFRKSIAAKVALPFQWPIVPRYTGAKNRFLWPRVNDFGASVPKPDGVPLELCVWGAIGDLSLESNVPNARDCFVPYSAKFSQIAEGDDRRKSFKRLHRWRYSPTAAYGNNEVHLHPTLPRRISVREGMRLQTLPDSYVFPQNVPLSAKYKMIGNGVPVRLARAIALSIRAYLSAF